jgi:pimeloyl-ACP methyl ester carboxylesterase
MAAPVIMVHGAFCGGWAFDAFRAPFEAAGHRCLALDLPGHGAGQPVAGLSMSDYAAAVMREIERQAEPPVLIGHSMGGLVSMMAASRTRVRAMVLLAPSPPWGVTGGSLEEAAQSFGLMSLGAYWTQAIEPDFSIFAGSSADRFSREEQKAMFARLVPESGRALYETLSWWLDPFLTTAAGPPLGGPPVLVLSGGRDRIHSPALARQIAERMGADFRQFDAMSHWLVAEPEHAEVSDAVLRWLPTAAKAAA